MISHDRAQRLLSARLDELLPPADHRALQEHLANCPECRLFAHQAEALAHDLRGLPFLPPSPAVSRAVMAEIRRGDGGFSPLAWLGGLRFSSGPALAVVSSFVLIAALAFTVTLALKPAGDRDDLTATNAAVALAPRTTPTPLAIAAPADATLPPTQPPAPTSIVAIATTRPAQAAPTATRTISIQAPPTPTPTLVPVNDAPPVQPPTVEIATDVPAGPAPTEPPQLAQGDTTQSMDLAQTARGKGGKNGQRTEAQAADAGQPISGSVDAALAPAATGSGDASATDSGTGTGGMYDAAAQPTIAPADAPDATPPPDDTVQPTIAPTGDQQLDAPQAEPGKSGDNQNNGAGKDQGGTDGAASEPPTPTPVAAFPQMPNGFGDTHMQVSLTAGQDGKPASISVAPVPPTATPVPTATATPDPASMTPTPTPAPDGGAADTSGTPADPAS